MNPAPVPRYGIQKLEALAQTLLRERWPAQAIPVDVELLTEREAGVVLEIERGLQARWSVPGATIYHPKEDRFTVLIDETVADGASGFYRFTVAEELGHLRLHRQVLRRIQTVEDAVALHVSPDYEYMERNAKWFASALLMPREALLHDAKTLYTGLVRQHGFEKTELVRRSLVIRLSQRYVVNVSPMQYRLEKWPLKVMEMVERALRERMNSLP